MELACPSWKCLTGFSEVKISKLNTLELAYRLEDITVVI